VTRALRYGLAGLALAMAVAGPLADRSADAQDARVDPEAAAALPGIHGADDRVTVEPRDWPWTAIGRLERLSGGFCTATLVDARHVLTAAHCIWDPDAGALRPAHDLLFAAAFHEGSAIALVPVAGYRLSPDYAPERGRSPEEAVRDWALVELARPLDGLAPVPVVAAAPSELERAAAEGRLTQAGYSQDRGDVLSVHAGCRIDRTVSEGRLIMHLCDAVSGASGSPLLIFDEPEPGHEGGLRLAAIHIGSAAADADASAGTPDATVSALDGLGIAVTASAFAGWLTEALADALAGTPTDALPASANAPNGRTIGTEEPDGTSPLAGGGTATTRASGSP